ncbi:MAG TPA: hypothetical protein VNO52_16315 [Methylomirabilota bacterium]|nr:hypothetical protein [Methylomirabilota bacterium]
MNMMSDVIYWAVGLVLAAAVAYLVNHFFSEEARDRRRRRRNYGRVTSRVKRPAVMLSVRTN